MTQLRLPQIEWPTAAVLIATLSACALIWIFAGEQRAELLALVASISAPVLAIMRALVGTPPSGPILALLAVVGASSLMGCGASALRTHATAASVTAAAIDTACDGVQTARAHEQDTAIAREAYREPAQSAADAVRARWAPAVAGCDVLAEAHDTWVTGLALAAAGAPFDVTSSLTLASGVLRVWDELVPLLTSLGVSVPSVLTELRSLSDDQR